MNMMNNMDNNVFQSGYHFFDTCIRSAFLNGYCSQDYYVSKRMELISILESIYNVQSVNDIPFDTKDALVSTVDLNPFNRRRYCIMWLMEHVETTDFYFNQPDMSIYVVNMPEYFKSFIKGDSSVSFDRDKSVELASKLMYIYMELFSFGVITSVYCTIYTMFNLYQYHGIPCFEKGANVDDVISFITKKIFLDSTAIKRISEDYKKMIDRVGKFNIDPYTISSCYNRIVFAYRKVFNKFRDNINGYVDIDRGGINV